MTASNYTHFDFELIKKDTGKAFLVVFEDDEETWVPQSVVADAEDYSEGDGPGTISIATWFCEKEGLA